MASTGGDYYRQRCWRIQLCEHYLAGCCYRRGPCTFAHNLWELERPPRELLYAATDYPNPGRELTKRFKAYVGAAYGVDAMPAWAVRACVKRDYYPAGYVSESGDAMEDRARSSGDSYEGFEMPQSIGAAGATITRSYVTEPVDAIDHGARSAGDSYEGGEMPQSIGAAGASIARSSGDACEGGAMPEPSIGAAGTSIAWLSGDACEGGAMSEAIPEPIGAPIAQGSGLVFEGGASFESIGSTVAKPMQKTKGMNKIS